MRQWRAYVAERKSLLTGCRGAVVRPADSREVAFLLDAAAQDAAPSALRFEHFNSIQAAHIWVKPPDRSP